MKLGTAQSSDACDPEVNVRHEGAGHAHTWAIVSTACMTCGHHVFTEGTWLCQILTGTKAKCRIMFRGRCGVHGQ
jgi:hypothetical protein